MRIVCISDTHSMHDRIAVPEGDVLLHAGDLTGSGTPAETYAAYAWLAKQPHERVVVVPGNHDFGLERQPHLRSLLQSSFPRVETLLDSDTMLGSLRVWGSPWQPWFHNWAFNFLPGPAGDVQAEEKWAEIPDDTAILITHGPPRGVLDETLRHKHVGCAALKARIAQLHSLRLHVFGHIHEGYGIERCGEVLHVNACICDALYDPDQKPLVIEVRDGVFTRVN